MHATYAFPKPRGFIGCLLFASISLASPSLSAQTFIGRDYLAEFPIDFQAFVFPAQKKSVINIRIENRSSRTVRIRLINEEQKAVYDEYASGPEFAGRFDVSALPYGTYTVELSTSSLQHRQEFQIMPRQTERVVLLTRPAEQKSLLARQ
ncbi:hypothetical protein HNV11_06975 [Spirosoma taeanense]|uniref:T9SS type A sorting domain-containing protein n=1 Tax=Spirosoma taeanense TaxID=2735870 RepID=A0A6M5Y8Q8_9BACT|nr:hypothetical protein [Spirosoma taeanense]QJW89152.1 hypothetical protein HNV11_06975 [Spirosoma taeanense]